MHALTKIEKLAKAGKQIENMIDNLDKGTQLAIMNKSSVQPLAFIEYDEDTIFIYEAVLVTIRNRIREGLIHD